MNSGARPIELYWGGRTPDSDFLYESTTREMLETGHLARFETAFSRGASPAYVQDRIRANAEDLIARLKAGAIVMVCGGSAMADGRARRIRTDSATPGHRRGDAAPPAPLSRRHLLNPIRGAAGRGPP